MKKAKIYAISSVKGGTGKTTTILNLAAMCNLLKHNVLVLDLDLAAGDIAARLDVDYDKDIYNCYEDITNHTFDKVENYIYSYKEGFDILPAPKDPRYANKIEPSFLSFLLSKVSLKYDVIFIDTNHLLSNINLFAFDYSDQIMYVFNNDSMNLKGLRTMVAIFEDMETDKMSLILNDANKKSTGDYSIPDITNIIKREIDYRIPKSFYQKKYDKYVIDGRIFLFDAQIRRKCKRAVRIYKSMAKSLLKED